MVKKFWKERYFCGLDLGAHSLKATLSQIGENQEFQIIGFNQSPTNGLKKGSVVRLDEFTDCIHVAISELAKRSKIKIKNISIGIGGELVQHRFTSAVIPLIDQGSKVITSFDIKKIKSQARLLSGHVDEYLLHEIPQFYNIDDVNIALNPIGLYGRKLEIKSLLIFVHNSLINNIIKAVNHAGYDVSNVQFSSYAATMAALNEYQKKQGCVFIDIGSTLTNILVFKSGLLQYISKIAIGGQVFTQQIARKLNLSYDLADNIKKSYALAISEESQNEEEILIKREAGYLPVKKEIIRRSIESSIENLINHVKEDLRMSNYYNQINDGIVLIGGGALLPGLAERIEQGTNLIVKMGKSNSFTNKNHNNVAHLASIGLTQHMNTKGYDLSSKGYNHTFAFFQKIRDVYQDYF